MEFCEKCKYWDIDMSWCDHFHNGRTEPNDFCSYGERKIFAQWIDIGNGIFKCSHCGHETRFYTDKPWWEEECPNCEACMKYERKMWTVASKDEILKRDDKTYCVVIADDEFFVLCPISQNKEEECVTTDYTKAEIYSNRTKINTLEELRFERV